MNAPVQSTSRNWIAAIVVSVVGALLLLGFLLFPNW